MQSDAVQGENKPLEYRFILLGALSLFYPIVGADWADFLNSRVEVPSKSRKSQKNLGSWPVDAFPGTPAVDGLCEFKVLIELCPLS
jgi:hypothetical protein